jgi:Bacterial cell division membrane protein
MPNSKENRVKRFYDYNLVIIIIFLTAFGLIMIYSASAYSAELGNLGHSHYFRRQGIIAVSGIVFMLLISRVDYRWLKKFPILVKFMYLIGIVSMIVVTFTPLGKEVNGQKRWLDFGNGFQLQPAEIIKLVLIILIAYMISQYHKSMGTLNNMIKFAVAISIPVILIVGNNLSSAIIVGAIGVMMMFVADKRWWIYALGTLLLVLTAWAFIVLGKIMVENGMLAAYRYHRVEVWKAPEKYPRDGGYQVLQGLYAIGSGGIMGKGLGASVQKLGPLPEAGNDMIFAIICEELGLCGAGLVIIMFAFMLWRMMNIASNAPDLFGAMLVIGVMCHIGLQVVLNIAVVTGAIPNTGVILPFISYGGTSVLFLMFEMALVLSVSNQIKVEI